VASERHTDDSLDDDGGRDTSVDGRELVGDPALVGAVDVEPLEVEGIDRERDGAPGSEGRLRPVAPATPPFGPPGAGRGAAARRASQRAQESLRRTAHRPLPRLEVGESPAQVREDVGAAAHGSNRRCHH
jgi:hypothetical protein